MIGTMALHSMPNPTLSFCRVAGVETAYPKHEGSGGVADKPAAEIFVSFVPQVNERYTEGDSCSLFSPKYHQSTLTLLRKSHPTSNDWKINLPATSRRGILFSCRAETVDEGDLAAARLEGIVPQPFHPYKLHAASSGVLNPRLRKKQLFQ
ncbi:hypothetical protein P4E94_13160 [Pontiellaceae bacterium B12219]|nr:hypothetical protein [Pontiellaceae bacterium B12219]